MLHSTFNSARHSTTSPELYIIIKDTLLTEGGAAGVTCHLVVCEADLITYQTGPQCQQSAS